MIAIATGMDALDKKIFSIFEDKGIKDIKIVNYREFLLKNDFDVVIMSNYLVGEIELELMLLELKEKDNRVIYLTNEDKLSELKLCFRYNVYDIVLDPIDPKMIFKLYESPNKFKDIKKMFLKVNAGESIDKDQDFERFRKIREVEDDSNEVLKQEIDSEKEEEYKKLMHENEKMKKENMRLKKEEESFKQKIKDEHKKSKEKDVKVETKIVEKTVKETVFEVPEDYKKVIAIISPEHTGKTTLAVNMAWYYSKNGVKTSLIDTDYKKKDIFYQFKDQCCNCMSIIGDAEDPYSLGIDVNNKLRVFTDAREIEVDLTQAELVKLILSAKKHSQVVIVDVSYDLDDDTVKNILDITDNTILVIDQRVSVLNRIPENIYKYRNNLSNLSVVINKYYTLKNVEKHEIINTYFKDVVVPGIEDYDYKIDKVFVLNDDAKSVLEGLSFTVPAIEKEGNYIKGNIKEICSSMYKVKEKKKKGFRLFGGRR